MTRLNPLTLTFLASTSNLNLDDCEDLPGKSGHAGFRQLITFQAFRSAHTHT